MRVHQPYRPSQRKHSPPSDGEESNDQRVGLRHALHQACEVVFADGTTQSCELLDLSSEGLSIMAFRPIPYDTRILVNFDLAREGQVERIRVVARVCYSSFEGNDGFRIGASYLEMDTKSEQVLRSLFDSVVDLEQ